MDIKQLGDKGLSLIKKYRFVVLILVVGIVLMLIPSNSGSHSDSLVSNEKQPAFCDPTEELETLLSQISGAGKVRIMLTVAAGEKTLYQTDQDQDEKGVQLETVIISDSSRNEHGLIEQIIAPQYRGAVVVCQGADDPAVKYAIMEAVKNMTGLGFDRISVLKMK